MITNYHQAIDYVFGRLNYERMSSTDYTPGDFKLARMHQILEGLGHPELALKCLHVAGTKGKGSTCHWLAFLLQQLGYKVGLFTSPHILVFEERFSINGELISHEQFVLLLNQLIELIKASKCPLEVLEQATFFELTTALAWLHFTNAQVDYVVLEVGMGGLYDTTNLCNPLVTAITSIDFDHMRVLGNTIPEIASQKAGIIKPGIPVVCAAKRTEAVDVVKLKSQELQAPCYHLGVDFHFQQVSHHLDDVSRYDFQVGDTIIKNLMVPLLGEHQADNLITALAMLHYALPDDFSKLALLLAKDNTLLTGMTLLLRIEVINHEPVVIVDAAHNPLSIRSLLTTLRQAYPGRNVILIFGCSKDKDIPAMLKLIIPGVDELILTQYTTNPRHLPHDQLQLICMELAQKNYPAYSNPLEAYQYALSQAGQSSIICVTGSFFLAAEIRAYLT